MEFFAILEIAQTTDEELIKNAYRKKLASVNPEDDPEGFKRLRNAYEQAIAWARRPKEEDRPKGPVDLLLDKFQDIYDRMADRVDPDAWKNLLQDPLFDSLDLEENAKWGLFVWLADHWRLPIRIWRVLDQQFFITENEEEFIEHLPREFVIYMEQKIEDSGRNSEFPYERFRATDERSAGFDGRADYDAFMTGYEEYCSLVEDEENLEAAEQKADYLEGLGITHPWFLLEKVRFLVKADREEDAKKLCGELLERDGDEVQVYLGCARIYKELGCVQECQPMFEKLLERKDYPDSVKYHCTSNLAELYEREERFEDARQMCLDALDILETDEVCDLLSRVNQVLIEKWTQTPDALTWEQGYQLAWCFIQTKRWEDGLAFLDEHHLLTEDLLKCHRTRAILALEAGQLEDVLVYCEKWRGRLEEMEKIEAPEMEAQEQDEIAEPEKDTWMPEDVRRDRLMQSWRVQGDAYHQRADRLQEESENTESPEEIEELLKKAEEAYDKAIAISPKDIGVQMSKLMLLRSRKQYEQMAELCEYIKSLDKGYYWAYFYAQEAYDNLRNGQGVIDNFYEAVRIYPGHAEIYERAAEVFWDYRQYRDMQGILDRADEAGVSSAKLKLKRLCFLEVTAEEEAAFREADAYAEKVIKELEEEEGVQPEILAAAYLERVYIHTDNRAKPFRSEEGIIEWATHSVELCDTVDARYSLGRALWLFRDEAENAMTHLKICEERGMQFCWMYYYIARCHEEFERWDDAIEYYKKATEADPEEDDFLWRIAWLYRRKFARTGQKVYADLAFEYLGKQEQLVEKNSSDYWQYSDLYGNLGEFERAVEEIDHALESDKRARNWGHKAQMLELMRKRDEAVPFYEKGIERELERGQDYGFSYSQLSDYFRETGKFEEGLAWFEAWMPKVKTEEQRGENFDHLRKLYLKMGQYDKALEMVVKRYGSTDLSGYVCDSWEREGVRIGDLLDVYQYYLTPEELREKVTAAIALLEGAGNEKLKEDLTGRYSAWREIAYTFAHYLMDDRMGLTYFRKALEMLEAMGDDADRNDRKEILHNLMACSSRLGEQGEVRKYADRFMEEISKQYDECKGLDLPVLEMHATSCIRRRHNLYQLFVWAYYTEDFKAAREYFKLMEASPWCSFCTNEDCTEYWYCRGMIAVLDGEREEAKKHFFHANACASSSNSEAKFELRRLEESI